MQRMRGSDGTAVAPVVGSEKTSPPSPTHTDGTERGRGRACAQATEGGWGGGQRLALGLRRKSDSHCGVSTEAPGAPRRGECELSRKQ